MDIRREIFRRNSTNVTPTLYGDTYSYFRLGFRLVTNLVVLTTRFFTWWV